VTFSRALTLSIVAGVPVQCDRARFERRGSVVPEPEDSAPGLRAYLHTRVKDSALCAWGSTGMQLTLVLLLPREAASVPIARHIVSAALTDTGVAPDCLDEVKVAVTEACTNVFRHAGHDRNYEVLINLDAAQLTIDVLDYGAGFGRRPTVEAAPEHDAEAGRDLALIQAFSDRAVFDSVTGQGASIHVIKQLNCDPKAVPATETKAAAGGGPSPAAPNPAVEPRVESHSSPVADEGSQR